jgi:hypothetical protein
MHILLKYTTYNIDLPIPLLGNRAIDQSIYGIMIDCSLSHRSVRLIDCASAKIAITSIWGLIASHPEYPGFAYQKIIRIISRQRECLYLAS